MSTYFLTHTPTTQIYTLSLHDALPISEALKLPATYVKSVRSTRPSRFASPAYVARTRTDVASTDRSEEHTSELQSRFDLVCRLLPEKKKNSGNRTYVPTLSLSTPNIHP